MRSRRWLAAALLAASGAAGFAWGQDGETKLTKEERAAKRAELKERAKSVRREVKTLDLLEAVGHVPGILAREGDFDAILESLAASPKEPKPLLERARALKLAALEEQNRILKKHHGKYAGIDEAEVWKRLEGARFEGVRYEDEFLVNILDDIEESARINVELDARVYKFDTVSFGFEKTTARAMLQTMADNLQFSWVIRGDTLYVYKERLEVLFDAEWVAQKKAAWKARQKQKIEEANRRDAEKAAEREKGAGKESPPAGGGSR